MSNKNIYCIIIALFAIFNLTVSNAQHYIGFTGGYSLGTFTNFVKKDDYKATYHFKSGAAFTSFYETKIDSICNLKIELQYRWQNADAKVDYSARHASFFSNVDYSFHSLNLNLILAFRLVEKEKFKLKFLLGPTFSYHLNTTAKGDGWNYYVQTQIDTNGNPHYIMTTQEWEKNERHSKDLSTFNIGMDLGLEFIIPINERIDFLIQNRYNIYFINIMNQNNFRYTSLLSGYLNIGLRYKFGAALTRKMVVQ